MTIPDTKSAPGPLSYSCLRSPLSHNHPSTHTLLLVIIVSSIMLSPVTFATLFLCAAPRLVCGLFTPTIPSATSVIKGNTEVILKWAYTPDKETAKDPFSSSDALCHLMWGNEGVSRSSALTFICIRRLTTRTASSYATSLQRSPD